MAEQIIPGDGVVAGYGRVNGRLAFAFAQDFTVFGGSLSETNAAKIVKIMDLAVKMGAPIVGLNDSGGARIQEGVVSLGGYADIFLRNTLASGVVPQISAIMGPCAGGAVYSPAITDFTVMVRNTSYMFVTGPDVIRTVTHEEVTKEELGGAMTHNEKSGVAHFAAPTTIATCLLLIRELLSFLPEQQPRRAAARRRHAIRSIGRTRRSRPSSPRRPNQPYDMRDVIARDRRRRLLSRGARALRAQHPRGLRAARRPSGGIVANQPAHLAGTLDIDASVKGARFVRFCDAFNIPLVTFEDVPGFLPGHRAGVRRHHPQRREAALRVRRGDGAQADRDHAQGVRRRVLRDVEQAPPDRRQLRLADGGDRGDGRRGGRQHPVQARARRGRRSPRPRARRRSPSTARSSPIPTSPPSAGSSTTSSGRARRGRKLITALGALETKRDKNPPKKHGNIPL